MDNHSIGYVSLNTFIKINRYKYTVEEVLDQYKKSKDGFEVNSEIKEIFKYCESEIRLLLGEIK